MRITHDRLLFVASRMTYRSVSCITVTFLDLISFDLGVLLRTPHASFEIQGFQPSAFFEVDCSNMLQLRATRSTHVPKLGFY
ncbi:MAG: hypothetical protein DWI22_16565 [Planctomycetota bacterium]|nr:MAG: hypothetical protein DWI22_16565 [Planctomycetota bacterium]